MLKGCLALAKSLQIRRKETPEKHCLAFTIRILPHTPLWAFSRTPSPPRLCDCQCSGCGWCPAAQCPVLPDGSAERPWGSSAAPSHHVCSALGSSPHSALPPSPPAVLEQAHNSQSVELMQSGHRSAPSPTMHFVCSVQYLQPVLLNQGRARRRGATPPQCWRGPPRGQELSHQTHSIAQNHISCALSRDRRSLWSRLFHFALFLATLSLRTKAAALAHAAGAPSTAGCGEGWFPTSRAGQHGAAF